MGGNWADSDSSLLFLKSCPWRRSLRLLID
jgi:hypothetical protein